VASTGRRIFSPQRWQAIAREAAMTALRGMPGYDGFLLSLCPLWSAVQIPPMSASFASVRVLEYIQREPRGADQYPGWDFRPSDSLRIYLHKLDEIVVRHLHLTDAGAGAWWVKEDLHTDAIKQEPRPWWDRVDWWRWDPPARVIQQREVSEFGVRLTDLDPDTGEVVSTRVFLSDDPAQAFQAWSDWQRAEAATTRAIETTFMQRYQAEKWQKNAGSEATMAKKDIPALMAWYRFGARPAKESTQRRLNDLARDALGLDPPSTHHNLRKKQGKVAKVFRRKAGNSRVS
jgi:hypothetical protein